MTTGVCFTTGFLAAGFFAGVAFSESSDIRTLSTGRKPTWLRLATD
jgi:hypothetical protein